MAILDKLEASILVNERVAPEFENHDLEPDSAAKIVRFIEAADDVPFGIQLAVRDSMRIKSTSLVFEIRIDGKWATGKFFDKKGHFIHPQRKDVCDIRVKSSTGWELRPLVFRAMETVEHSRESIPSDQRLRSLGTICIKVFHVDKLGRPRRAGSSARGAFTGHTEMEKLPENKITAMNVTHTAGLGQARKILTPRRQPIRYVDGSNVHFAEFVFRYCSRGESENHDSLSRNMFKVQNLHNPTIYRPHETAADVKNEAALQSLGLLARTPPPPTLAERPVEEWSLEELREFARRRQKSSTDTATMPGTDLASTDSKIKVESSAKRDISRGVKREADSEDEGIRASAKVRKPGYVKTTHKREIIELSDTE